MAEGLRHCRSAVNTHYGIIVGEIELVLTSHKIKFDDTQRNFCGQTYIYFKPIHQLNFVSALRSSSAMQPNDFRVSLCLLSKFMIILAALYHVEASANGHSVTY